MNLQGRHYRDQEDPSNPSCDYENKGEKCVFFSQEQEFSDVPYPSDISLGPLSSETQGSSGTDLAQILQALNQQKKASDQQFASLQEQINKLAGNSSNMATPPRQNPQVELPQAQNVAPQGLIAPPQTPSGAAQTLVHARSGTPSASQTVPQQLVNAASALTAHLRTNVQQEQNLGSQELTIGALRKDSAISEAANRQLFNHVHDVPALNPSPADGINRLASNNVSTVDQLYAATMRNKQLKAFEFAASGQFSYKNQLRQDNINATSFAYGSFKHLEAAMLGLVQMSQSEFLARLRHLKNVYEVACLSSNLTSFCDPAWQLAREYDTRVVSDIESGAKTWTSLSNSLETDAIYCANQVVEQRNRTKKSKDSTKKSKDTNGKACTTFNSHRSSDGCAWEHKNEGQTCVFEHYCSWCKTNRDVKDKHKLIHCEHKTSE